MTTLTSVLPDGYAVRRPMPLDAEAVFRLQVAHNTAVVGFADCTLADVADRLVEPGFDRDTDGWLVVSDDGRPAGYGIAFGKGDRSTVEVEVTSLDPVIASWLLDRTMERAHQMGHDSGHSEVTVDAFVYRADEPLRASLADHGFVLATTYHRMRIDHTGPVTRPPVPDGVVVRRGAYDDASRWTAHEVIIECFHDQFGFVARPHEEWVEARSARTLFDWSQLTTLEIDGRAVAVRDCSDASLEAENCGHVAQLGVVAEFRGRGLAKFLLRDAFARDAAAGRRGTILLVDTNNPTPALELYLSVGMAATLVFEGWRRILPV